MMLASFMATMFSSDKRGNPNPPAPNLTSTAFPFQYDLSLTKLSQTADNKARMPEGKCENQFSRPQYDFSQDALIESPENNEKSTKTATAKQ
uniref:Uncharacterized protein n=1 Tax=Rhipicephalus zambeziensis TaxID=60191 RepID=A0A224YAS3_9ACAR